MKPKLKVSVSIMCAYFDADRRRLAESLQKKLADSDAFYHVMIVDALTRTGEAWTLAQRAWWCGQTLGADYHMVLQDDIIPCQYFEDQSIEAIEGLKKRLHHFNALLPPIVGFYCTYPEMRTAHAQRAGWLETYDGAWGQAIALPTTDIPNFLIWQQQNVQADYKHDDERIGLWAMLAGRRIYQTVPSLVDHMKIKSTLGHTWNNRAAVFTGTGPYPDWSRASILGPVSPRFSPKDAESILVPGREFVWPTRASEPPSLKSLRSPSKT